MNRSPLRAFVLIPLLLTCFALSPQARATCQDACLTNGNTVLGDDALVNNTTGGENTAVGFQALMSNTTGFVNTAIGNQALSSNTTGPYNTASGFAVLASNTTGAANTASGYEALVSNTTGNQNTATGVAALLSNNGNDNTGIGSAALEFNTTGNNNTATGFGALQFNTTGSFNTADGFQALSGNAFSTGNNNTASGYQALFSNTIGNNNTAAGDNALLNNTKGNNNTAAGYQALLNNRTGNNNIALGVLSGSNLSNGDNNIDIGNGGVAGEFNHIRIGTPGVQSATFIAGISGVIVPAGVGVIVGTDGTLGTVVSSERYKNDIKPMDERSEAILALKPVTFRYKHELDPKGVPQFGLVAEQVEKINPDLVARDDQGKPYTVRYEAVNAMLLNEFLKEHRKVQELEANDAQQQNALKALTAVVKEQASQIQKVSSQLHLSKPEPKTVLK